jgi:hypothetical protein
MASPFAVFRKKKKLWLAVLGLMAIISFVFLPIILQNMGSRTVQNPVVVKTSKYGNLKAYDLHFLLQQRQKIIAVLGDVVQLTGFNPQVQQYLMWRTQIGPATEESVVETWLLARYGQQMGMVISNDAIDAFLKDLTQDRVPTASILSVLKRHGFSDFRFYHDMRDELAAAQLKRMFEISLYGMPPAERWQYFARVYQMATIDAVPVAVAKFADGIAEPPVEELKTFFEAHKDKYARPDSPDPGFREPQKVALEYFKAELDKFTAPGMITDEEVKERYEKHKEMYDQLEKGRAEEKPTTEKATEEGDKKAVEPKEKDAESTKDTKEPEATKESEKEKETPKESKDTSALERPSPFMLTALTQSEPASEPAAAKEEKPAETTPQAAATKEEKPAETTSQPPAQEKPAEAKTGLTETLKTRIRQEIAEEKIGNIFKGLREQMNEYQREWRKYEAERIRHQGTEEGETAKKVELSPPPKPDFEALAKQHGLSTGSTELVSEWQARELEIGSSLVNGQVPVWRYVFSLARFSPEDSMNLTGDRYLLWKTQETKERIPEFNDEGVQKEVLHVWRMVKARELALKEARALAEKASKAEKPLKEALADQPDLNVIAPGPFSWVTFGHVPAGSAPGAARLSSVEGVDMAGEEFMKIVFSLESGQVGAALNAPQTVAYVIRLNDLTPPHEMLWRQFEKENFRKYASVAGPDQEKMKKAWLQGIKKAANLEWTADHKAARVSQRGPEPEPQDQGDDF